MFSSRCGVRGINNFETCWYKAIITFEVLIGTFSSINISHPYCVSFLTCVICTCLNFTPESQFENDNRVCKCDQRAGIN